MRFSTLDEWLAWQETQNKIELGLARCGRVLKQMDLQRPAHRVITVGGTNGKGSSVALLEAILTSAGYRVGAYSSPHLLNYNERVRINGLPVEDAQLCESFERIDQARAETLLTYFEFGTLAAFDIFARLPVDVSILEVGLGGRLDAVNLLDADVALVTSIGIDHVEFLGPDRESIGYEKAGIFRTGRPAMCGDPDPPQSLIRHADAIDALLYTLNRDFGYEAYSTLTWSWWSGNRYYGELPYPNLRGAFQLQNAAGVLMALEAIHEHLPVSRTDIANGLTTIKLSGRFQILPGSVTRIFDVAHNPDGARVLAAALREEAGTGRSLAVFAMLADKDIAGVVDSMRELIDGWHVAGLPVPRGLSGDELGQRMESLGINHVYRHDSVAKAYCEAVMAAREGDRVITFGSFYTVAEALQSQSHL